MRVLCNAGRSTFSRLSFLGHQRWSEVKETVVVLLSCIYDGEKMCMCVYGEGDNALLLLLRQLEEERTHAQELGPRVSRGNVSSSRN